MPRELAASQEISSGSRSRLLEDFLQLPSVEKERRKHDMDQEEAKDEERRKGKRERKRDKQRQTSRAYPISTL
jgi:hypothetical protein